ncbi:hypothetical protein [Actinocrispum wychmicini]|uniref:Uncharacterized protein n=1 Tax=Actinocrispum wychmicini TaxID=1213861 RepID=A0A4V2S833_9PSEU|nr:hypothetical protein [Actinocrispum wychmicini]TCO62210.1 hypothetical protein EV192_102347 [Actinocrispum wychmicini]
MDNAYGNESKRIEKTNAERYQASAQYGWQFRPDAPELLDRWNVMPFTQRGDKRLAFGVLSGAYQGLPFTMFDFHRRPKVTSSYTKYTHRHMNDRDTIEIESVWVVTLRAPMPRFQIVSSTAPTYEVDHYPEPPTYDPKFNRWYKIIDTDPQVATQLLTPPVMSTMRQLKTHNWALVGTDLVYVENPIFGRTKPDEVLQALGKLYTLVSLLPIGPPAPPQYQQPQPNFQYQQPYPQYRYPQPGYPQR